MPRDDVRIINPFLIAIALIVVVAGVGAAIWLTLAEEPTPPKDEIIKIVRTEEAASEEPESARETAEDQDESAEQVTERTPSGASPSRVWGSVLQAETQSPLPDVEVIAKKTRESDPVRLKSKSDGSFRFDELPDGEWYLIAQATGSARVHSREYFGHAVVTPGAKIDNVAVQVVQPATLAGKVETFIGKPVPGAVVQVFAGWNLKGQAVTSSPWGGKKDLGDALSHEFFAETVSDDQGQFSFEGLEAGTYDLVANGEGFARAVQLGAPTGSDEAMFRLEPEVRIEGTVSLFTNREPLSGATVTVQFDAPGFPQFSGSVLTDASGQYTITGLPRKSKLVIQAVSGENESAPYNRTILGQAGTQTRDLMIIPDRRIFGRVMNAHTKMAISGIEIWTENRLGTVRSTSTGPDGQFSFQTGIAVHKVQFRKPGEFRESEWIDVIFEELEKEREIGPVEMVEGLTLEGKVTDAKSKFPIPGAVVRAIPAEEKVLDLEDLPSSVTDGAGRFLLEGVPRGRHYLSGEKFGYSPGYASPLGNDETSGKRQPLGVEPPGPLEGFEIVLARIPTVTVGGTVVDQKKQGVAGSDLLLTPSSSMEQSPIPSVQTDAEGKFEVKEVPIGVYSLSVNHLDYWPAGIDSMVLRKGKETSGLEIVLESKQSLEVSGKVLDPDGFPLENVSIGAFFGKKETLYAARVLSGNASLSLKQIPEKAMQESTAGTGWTKTDADGTFALEGLREGFYTVVAGDVYASQYKYDVEAGSTGVDFQLSWGGGIAGRVYQADGQTPCTKFKILLKAVSVDPILTTHLSSREEFNQGQAFNAPDGSFEISGLPNGYYTLTVLAEGFGEANVFGISVENGNYPPDYSIVLNGGGGIKGHVFAPLTGGSAGQMKGIAGATVRLGEVSKETDGAGTFEFKGLAQDQYAILVEHSDYAPVFKSRINVTSGQTTDIGQIQLGSGGSIEGRVFFKDGTGAGGYVIQVDGTDGLDWGKDFGYNLARADQDGYFQIPSLSPGSYRLTVRQPSAVQGKVLSEYGRPILTRSVEVQGEDATQVQLVVDEGAYVSGTVVLKGRPLANSTLVLYPRYGTDLQELITLTDSQGRYSFEGVPAGTYEVFAGEYSDDPKRASLTVPNTEEHTQDFTF